MGSWNIWCFIPKASTCLFSNKIYEAKHKHTHAHIGAWHTKQLFHTDFDMYGIDHTVQYNICLFGSWNREDVKFMCHKNACAKDTYFKRMVYPSETISANVRTIFQLDTRSLSVGFCRYQHTHIKWRTMSVPTREIQWMESGKNPMGRHDIDKNCDRKYSLWAENGMLLFVQNPMQSADDDKTENHGFAFNCFNFSCLWVEIRNWISTHRIPFYWVDFF